MNRKVKIPPVTLLLVLSTICTSEIAIPGMITSCQAMEPEKDGKAVHVNNYIEKALDPLSWTRTTAGAVNVHFKKAYKDKPVSLDCNGKKVNRPNHSLAHGLRQGLLASDIVDALNSTALSFKNQEAINITKWVKEKMEKDLFFRQKVEYTSAFQRTGRESEASSSGKHKDAYEKYERKDAANFDADVKKHIGHGKVFKDAYEAQVFKEAILWSTAKEGKIDPLKNEDLKFLRKVLHTAHDLDLRRLPFDTTKGGIGNSFQRMVSTELFGDNSYINSERVLIDRLWERSGEYLRATGDRDRDPNYVKIHNDYNKKVFYDMGMQLTGMATRYSIPLCPPTPKPTANL